MLAFGPLVVLVTILAAGCGATKATKGELGPPSERSEFGHIVSLIRQDDHFELGFDPAWFLSGETANRAAAQDGAVEPGEPVPNDNYVVEEGHRLLTYLVPDSAQVTVLTNNDSGILSTPISVAELAQLVKGRTLKQIQLFESLETGVWITVTIDTVRTIDQQYRP